MAETIMRPLSAPFALLDVTDVALPEGLQPGRADLPIGLIDPARKVGQETSKQRVRIADPSNLPHQLDLLIVHEREARTLLSRTVARRSSSATYRGARVAEPMNTIRWNKLIGFTGRSKAT